ncbi:hypothetical protein ACIP5Y_24860 [Nocardia sp. NPDC088792]|uniref:hypothetical protein n=1 Tax=Nocardia sp. NPDC088792 TaxID=3364332 RepID=UPI0037F192F6
MKTGKISVAQPNGQTVRERPPRFISPHEREHEDDIRQLKAAALELVRIAENVREVSQRTTSLAGQPPPLFAPQTGLAMTYGLLGTLTNSKGLGFAFTGGLVGALTGALGGVFGQTSLAVQIMVSSLSLRLAALQLIHPELTEDPRLVRFIDAAFAGNEIETIEALQMLFKDRGAVTGLSGLAPMFAEILCVKALQDKNPLNDVSAWGVASGKAGPTAGLLLGVSTAVMTRLDRGAGGARPIDAGPHVSTALADEGSLLGFLRNIVLLGNDGRIVIQTIRAKDGVERFVVQVPGMRPGRARNESPQDLVGAFTATLKNESTYSGALHSAIDQYGIPDGAEIALIGHSAGGPAIMNLTQETEFCRRFRVTHAVAIGSPVSHKHPADPETWVASITNQHDIVPSLDGLGAGSCFDLHPDWCIVSYTEPSHQFPECHSPAHYLHDLEHLLPEAVEYLEEQFAPYHGEVSRTQLYQTYDQPPRPPGYPFLAVPTQTISTTSGPVQLPVVCSDGRGLIAFFAAEAKAAVALPDSRDLGKLVPVGPGRVLAAMLALDQRDGSLAPFRCIAAGLVVPGPWKSGWHTLTELLGSADQGGIGIRPLGMMVTTAEADDLNREVWGYPSLRADVTVTVGPLRASVAAYAEDGQVLGMTGLLGPSVPYPARDLVFYSRLGRIVQRSQMDIKGRIWAHPASLARLHIGPSQEPIAQRLRELGLNGARPLLCLSTRGFQSRIGAGAPLTT